MRHHDQNESLLKVYITVFFSIFHLQNDEKNHRLTYRFRAIKILVFWTAGIDILQLSMSTLYKVGQKWSWDVCWNSNFKSKWFWTLVSTWCLAKIGLCTFAYLELWMPGLEGAPVCSQPCEVGFSSAATSLHLQSRLASCSRGCNRRFPRAWREDRKQRGTSRKQWAGHVPLWLLLPTMLQEYNVLQVQVWSPEARAHKFDSGLSSPAFNIFYLLSSLELTGWCEQVCFTQFVSQTFCVHLWQCARWRSQKFQVSDSLVAEHLKQPITMIKLCRSHKTE